MANGMRTEPAHLPFPLRKNLSVDALRDRARETGPKTFEVIRRMFDEPDFYSFIIKTPYIA